MIHLFLILGPIVPENLEGESDHEALKYVENAPTPSISEQSRSNVLSSPDLGFPVFQSRQT